MSILARGVALSGDLRESMIKAFETGLSSYEIPENFNLPLSSVQNIITKFKNSGNVDICNRTGHPLTAKPRDCQIFKENRRYLSASITVQWREQIQKSVSVDSCKQMMKKMGYKFYKVYFKIFKFCINYDNLNH